MAFTDTQVRLLKAKLDPRYIRTRNSNGNTLSYVEGWHAIAEANRIFGYEAWDRRTVSATCVWTEAKAGTYRAVYTAKVRITVRAGDIKVVREGSGTCEAIAVTAGQAHELSLKGAETDATKRALANLVIPLALRSMIPSKMVSGNNLALEIFGPNLGCCVRRPVRQYPVMTCRPHLLRPCVKQ
jgi:recombination DNA repair RAD52 pathway protein